MILLEKDSPTLTPLSKPTQTKLHILQEAVSPFCYRIVLVIFPTVGIFSPGTMCVCASVCGCVVAVSFEAGFHTAGQVSPEQ